VTPSGAPATAPEAGWPGGQAGERLARWLTGCLPGTRPPLAGTVLAGGNSNVTVLLADAAGQRLVLRRPPAGAVLATAHDVLREARVLAALAGAGAPVPAVLATCEDSGVIGAPFFAMQYLDGLPCHGADDASALAPAVRRASGESLARTLAALHGLDVDAIGLGGLGPRDGYVARQLRRWRRQVDAGRQRPTPDIDVTHAILSGCVPPQRRTAVVHGDYRLDNCVLNAGGGVAGVVDWEICALGDPLADLGVLLA
jgi:aminoglycoside phosphotransferase (APT) family kinase protein